MFLFYFLAILAALCWTVASLISADVTRNIGGLVFNRLEIIFCFNHTSIIHNYYKYMGKQFILNHLNIIIISGIIGIFLGDTLLFMALQKIGPRRNNILIFFSSSIYCFIKYFLFK